MSKLNVQLLFDCLCDCVLHELSAKEVIRAYDDSNDIMPIIRFVQAERRGRKLPPLDFALKPEGLKLGWSSWNSGGGCMIWSYEYTGSKGNTHSIHVSDECMVNCNISREEYWKLEHEDQECTHLGEYMHFSENPKISFLLCPWTGQELADLIEHDVKIILEYI
jgi:hypothetical protein